MTPPVSGGVPEQGLRENVKRALWNLMAAYENAHRNGDVPGVVNEETTTFWRLHDEFLAALERPRPALPEPELPDNDGTAWDCHECGTKVTGPSYAPRCPHCGKPEMGVSGTQEGAKP